MGWFKKLMRGDIGGAVKEGWNSVKGVAAPVIGTAIAGPLGGALSGVLGGTAGKFLGQQIGNAAAGAIGGSGGGVNFLGGGNNGAVGQTFFPSGGNSFDNALRLYSLFSNNKPEAPKKLTMSDIGSNLSQLPFFSALQGVVNNNGMSKVGANIESEKSRVLGQPLGWGAARTNAAKSNLTSDLAEQNRKNMNRLTASMAARGLSGGVMTTGQRAAMNDYNDALQRGLNELTQSSEEAIRSDRIQQNSDVAKLLGMSGETASNINNTTLDAFSKMMQGVGSNVDLYNAQLKGYDTDRQAWSDMFGSMAQAGSMPQMATGTGAQTNTGTQAVNAMVQDPQMQNLAGAFGNGLVNFFTGATPSNAANGYVNYFSNPNTGAGQKVTDFISNPWGTVKDIWNNNIPTTITATPKFPASTPIQTKTRNVWDQIYGR